MTAPTVFISYSRRQLYFAEALALHLQATGLAVWFDLQQLHVGSVWADGLKDGVQGAGKLVLVVSRAALASPWTRAEWQGMVDKGAELVLAVFEDVDLPPELADRPSFDFRVGFDTPLRDLAAYLAGRGPARHDAVAAPNRLGLPRRLPAMPAAIVAALALPAAVALPALTSALHSGGSWTIGWFGFWAICAVWIAGRTALPFWRRTLGFEALVKGLRRSVAVGFVTLLSAAVLATALPAPWWPLPVALALAWLATLSLLLGPLGRSATLLRWMPPDEALQPLRRRVHGALLAAGEPLPEVRNGADPSPDGPALRIALHAAAADRPLARRVQRILEAQGHSCVAADAAPDHRVAILSNRSPQPWIQALTRAHAGRLVCVVATSIELGDRLADTARYQWVDFRSGDRRDIETLAHALADPGSDRRAHALEATPEAIDRWKVPPGLRLLRSATEVFGGFALVFALTDGVGMAIMPLWRCPVDFQDLPRSLLLGGTGALFLLLSSRALVDRRVPALVMYPLLIGALVAVALQARVLPEFLRDAAWVPLAAYLPFVLYSLIDGRHWLPAWAPVAADEVGIRRSVARAFRRRNLVVVGGWTGAVVVSALAIGLFLGSPCTPDRPTAPRPADGA